MRPRRRLSGSSASSSAAIGETRVARRAGLSAEASVTRIPTSRATTTVRVAITVPVLGRSMPKDLNTALSAAAKPMPPSTPSTDPSTPITAASTTTERRIWGRVAPSVRSSPSSRMRWAIVMLKMLKIRNEPTTRVTPPNTSSTIWKNDRSSAMSCDWRSAAC
jgi:hypothetical protein